MNSTIELPWSLFKTFIGFADVSYHHFTRDNTYFLFGIKGPLMVHSAIYKDGGADQLDFENNYQAGSHKPVFMRNQISYNAGGGTVYTAEVTSAKRLLVEAIGQTSPVPLVDAYCVNNNFMNGGSKAMNVNGAVTPVEFSIAPPSGELWYATGVSILMIDDGTSSAGVFGSLGAALTNGLELQARVTKSGTPLTKTIFNMKDNADLVNRFRGTFTSPMVSGLGAANGFLETIDGFFGFFAFPVPLRLNGTNGDFLKWRVRDNLTGLGNLTSTYLAWTEF